MIASICFERSEQRAATINLSNKRRNLRALKAKYPNVYPDPDEVEAFDDIDLLVDEDDEDDEDIDLLVRQLRNNHGHDRMGGNGGQGMAI